MSQQNDVTTSSTGPAERKPSVADSASGGGKDSSQRPSGRFAFIWPLHGDSNVGPFAVIITAILLISLTVSMLLLIARYWPVCEVQEEVQSNNAPSPPNTNASPTPSGNATAAANVNVNTGTAPGSTLPTQPAPAPSPNQSPTPGVVVPGLDADHVEPKSGPITGKALVVIKGKRFGTTAAGMTVTFDGLPGRISSVSDESISVRTPAHSEGTVDVVVSKSDKDKDVLHAEYTYICPAPTGSVLFAMLIMAGMLGGCIHALRSLYWYAGNRELKWSWLPMYYILPFTGAAMAMIFSLLIFAGFVDNTTGRSQALFIIAAAGLVGMFSQQAALKLTDVANAFFTKPGKGGDPKPQESLSVGQAPTKSAPITATAMSPVQGAVSTVVKIMGSGFNTSTTVSFGTTPAKVTSFDSTSITVEAPPGSGDVDVVVRSGDQSAKLPGKFKYT